MIITNPTEIEKRSFEIIDKELQNKGKELPVETAHIIKRVIHTTADFEFTDIIEIHERAIALFVDAIKNGCSIYTDTNMIAAGVNKKILANYNCNIYTLVSNDKVIKKSKNTGLTRSIIGIEEACKNENTKIFVIGNAPTALFKLKELIENGLAKPKCIIGVPVGFVGAAESKEQIKKIGIPYIITNGRKGGSTVAAAILNAIIYSLK
jgi:precorrin-8X/cobalt-precorrin-8 methylmutase